MFGKQELITFKFITKIIFRKVEIKYLFYLELIYDLI